ncbi:MAG: 1-acyl-sn-glycerol-3-phosphate acyltransferase, partial [Deltaproteobacteria bacterium]|nr:1-acyl-sn-glycerol-3-phosphate acyltransferase [Deltaproteobacteria bacterium]
GRGGSVLVFPEGTRGDGGALLPFRSGAFRLARAAGIPLLPVGLAGAGTLLPRRGTPHPGGVLALVVGEPLHSLPDEDVEQLSARARSAIEALRAEAQGLL